MLTTTKNYFQDFLKNSKEFVHLKRWYKFIQSRNEVQAAITTLPKDIEIKPVKYEKPVKSEDQKVNSRGPAKRTKGDHQEKQTKDEGKFVELEGRCDFYHDKNHGVPLNLKKEQFCSTKAKTQ